MNWIYLSTCIILTLLVQTECSGLFELRLKSFRNDFGRNSLGGCCTEQQTQNGTCLGTCKTRFRICLKHYQAKIDTTSPCTFGDVVTPVLGDNTFNVTNSLRNSQSDSINPIAFPFEFSWPGHFTLIVEAYHDTNETSSSPGVLISRISIQKVLDVSSKWTQDSHKNKHSTLDFEFRVTCLANYYGSGCANLCRPRDDQFGHYTCSQDGNVVCLSGWQGDYCTKPRCSPGCNEQHGHCNKPNECICSAGWKGAHCDECEPYPGCVHGTCKKPWECVCKEGWGGLFCNQDLNFCTNHKPCLNNGTCFNTGQGSYTCVCAPGFTGNDCEEKISDCVKNPCLNNGICIDDASKQTYTCQCPDGWTGKHCEKEIVTCSTKPCLHGGICRDTNKGFKCECPSGYSGMRCEIQVDNCNPNPCANGGTCLNKGNHFQCKCPSGFTGSRCDENIDDCQGNPCLNGGSCVDLVNQFRCQCIPGFIGLYCQDKVDLCLTKPCANGGTCRNLNNDYACSCRPGFTGKDCSVDVDECQSAPCKNGGTCVNRVNSFQCVCAGGFRGVTCEDEAYSAAWDLGGNTGRHVSSTLDSARSDSLSGGQIVLIAILSIAVPVIAICAIAVVICMKKKRKREQEKDDAEARKQNEQNQSHISHLQQHHHNSMAAIKRTSNSASTLDTSHHQVIKNTWDKSVNNVMSNSMSLDDSCGVLNTSLYGGMSNYSDHTTSSGQTGGVILTSTGGMECFQAQILPQTLQRAKSQKQLNTDPALMHRASQILSHQQQNQQQTQTPSAKELGLDKRISVLSDAQLCNTRWSVQQAASNRQLVGPCSPPHM